MTDKLDEAEKWLLKQNPQYMPTMAAFRKRFDLNLEELGAIVSRNEDIAVRMEVDQVCDHPMPEPIPKWEDCLDRITNADLKAMFRRKISALVTLVVSELGEHMQAAGANGIQLSGPVDLSETMSSEWPDFYFTAQVKRVGKSFKYEISGEWNLETPQGTQTNTVQAKET